MTQKELSEKVALLKDGQIVEIANDWFRACRVAEDSGDWPCEACDLDSICKGDVGQVCSELDFPFYDRWYLKLAHP